MLPPSLSEYLHVAGCPSHLFMRTCFSLCCLFLLRVSLLLVGVRKKLAQGHRQQAVKSEAHIARVLSSDVFLGDLEQSSKLACAGMNDIITCISICYTGCAEEVNPTLLLNTGS